MATIRNKAVIVTSDGTTVNINVGAIEGYQMSEQEFRIRISDEEGLDLLICEFKKTLDQFSVDPLTAPFSTIKTRLDGNYKL